MSNVVNEEIGDEPAAGGTASSDATGHDVLDSPAAADDPAVDEDVDVGAVAAEFVLGTLNSEERARANKLLESDPHFRDNILFYEYFQGDNGAGLGASHQTGWTALVAKLLQQSGE